MLLYSIALITVGASVVLPVYGRSSWLNIITSAALLCVGLLVAAWTSRAATVIYPARIERRGLFGAQTLATDDISDFRVVARRYEPSYMHITARQPALEIPP